MNAPGLSLFQNAESIKINSSLERAQEEEALEDQRRRNEELGNLLQNAFDDLEDDETTVDSTTNFQSDLVDSNDNHRRKHIPMESTRQNNVQMPTQEGYEVEFQQCKTLLESKTRELENIKQMAHEEFKKREELQKRLMITEAELDRALACKNNTHELLVESKEKCSNLENTIEKIRCEKKSLEVENNTLLGKLETAQTLLSDVQRKYDMVERDLNKNTERNAEVRRKHMEDRHRAEIEMMQQQMEQLADKLDKKASELENMTTRYNALQSSQQAMLVDKASKINELNNALCETQKKYEELSSQQNYFQENVRLQKLVSSLQTQIVGMEKTISTLTERLDKTTAELDVMDSVLHQHNLEDTPVGRLSQTRGKVVGSTPLNTMDRMGSLKDELYRALANVKGKREEIRKLKITLEEKNSEVRALREEENKALVQINTLKQENIRFENRLKVLEEESETKLIRCEAEIKSLKEELDELKTKKQLLEEEVDKLKNEQIVHETERRQLDAQFKNVEIDLEELKQEHENMKVNYQQILQENKNLRGRTTTDNLRLELEKHKFLLKDAKAECDRIKNLYTEISNAKEALAYEIEKMRNTDNVKELQEERERNASLQRALQLAEVKSSELVKIMESEKIFHEREISALKEKIDKDRSVNPTKPNSDSDSNCNKCMDYLAEITKFEIQNLKLANVNSHSKKEIDDLAQELNKAKSLITELTEKIEISKQQETIIKELKMKAQQFEEYIKTQSSSSEKSSTSPKKTCSSSDKGIGTSPESEKSRVKEIESRLRNEMAKIFANEIKQYQSQLHKNEAEFICLRKEYMVITAELNQRQVEVDVLKSAILAERERMEEILGEKDEEYHKQLNERNVLLSKCRDELLAKNQRIEDISKDLSERQAQIEAERKSMKAVMLQWEKQQKNVENIEKEWQSKLKELQESYKCDIDSWQTKYNSAKRTAANYKRYSEDKEAHMLKEYDRIKSEYDASITKIELHMKETLQKKYREMKEEFLAIEKRRDKEKDCDKENQSKN